MTDFVGWEYENVAAFDDNDAAVRFANELESQIPIEELDETKSVEIEVFTLR